MRLWIGLSVAVVAAVACGVLIGRTYPSVQARARFKDEGRRSEKNATDSHFCRKPWHCVHNAFNNYTEAWLENGTEKISLPNSNIPHGSMVSFMPRNDGEAMHPDTPFLGGLERRYRMHVDVPREREDFEDGDDQ